MKTERSPLYTKALSTGNEINGFFCHPRKSDSSVDQQRSTNHKVVVTTTTQILPSKMTSVAPVFVINNQLPAFDEKYFTTAEICAAAEKRFGYESVEGAQRIGGLWRIYPRSAGVRQKLLLQGFPLRGIEVEVKGTNPFLVTAPDGSQREIPSTKVIIGNIPLSVSDDELLKALKQLHVNIRSKVILEKGRDSNGKLTRWKTGRRIVYIDVPAKPLPKSLEVGSFKASLFHREQKEADRLRDADCRNCLQKGHAAAACKEPMKCRQCFQDSHKGGDTLCNLTPTSPSQKMETNKSNTTDKGEAEQPAKENAASAHQPRDKERKERKDNRGRTANRTSTGSSQRKLNFLKNNSRSTSTKRRLPTEASPPQQQAKHHRRDRERKGSDGGQPTDNDADDEPSDEPASGGE